MGLVRTTAALGLAATAAGFHVQPQMQPVCAPFAATCSRVSVHPCCMAGDEPMLSAETSRRAVLAGLLGVGLGVNADTAYAGYVTSLGFETTKPADADIDDDLLKSKDVQAGLESLKTYKSSAKALKQSFDKDTNMPLIPSIRKDFDFSKLRSDLNIVTTVFDDTTQLTIDRLSRSILYDLTELENASRFKKGEEARTEKKVANVAKWFNKLDTDFDAFLSYFA